VEVVVPSRTSPRAVERFLERHRSWIERKQDEARQRAVPPAPFPPPRIELSSCAEDWAIQVAGGSGSLELTRTGPGSLILAGDVSHGHDVRLLLRHWLTERAREVLTPQLAQVAREHGFRYERVLIRRQRTRWGSCSNRGTISLNCCLLFQRAAVVHYLLIHELVHTMHMNHSRRFWQRVQRHCPDYQSLDRELLDGWRRVPSWVFGDE
jgi:predicted metal-dependent hydrolase